MNSGIEFRVRYFDHFAKFVNNHFRKFGVTYRPVRITR
jgi:hypothetical protein